MSETPVVSIHESTFAQSDKTDAILVVEGKKLHVNKTLLSCHSDYFNTLFNSDFKEKSMQEIPIESVKFEDFATVLSLFHPNPIEPTIENSERLLQLADRFLLPAAKRHVELLVALSNMDKFKKLELADRYECEIILSQVLNSFRNPTDYKNMFKVGKHFSDKTKSKIFDDFFSSFGENL